MKRKSSGLKMFGHSMGLISPRYNDIPNHIAITLKIRNLPFFIKFGVALQHLGLLMLYISIRVRDKGDEKFLAYAGR